MEGVVVGGIFFFVARKCWFWFELGVVAMVVINKVGSLGVYYYCLVV